MLLVRGITRSDIIINYKEILIILANLVVSRDRAGFEIKISTRKELLW